VDGGVTTLACPNICFSHNMRDGFPLLTTKKVAWKAVRVELEGFIRGITTKQWYKDRGCKIWNEWANPEVVRARLDDIDHQYTMACEGALGCEPEEQPEPLPDELELRKLVQLEEQDLGPIYGFQWRRFGQCYDENDNGWVDKEVANDADQLGRIVDTLLNNPMDRRMVCSAWNPLHISRMALPPCHWGWNVTVIGDELNLFWVQRSCDLMLGVPFNIASYALLLELLARTARLKPGNLSGMLVDCHIYENQIEAAKAQVQREPRELPWIRFTNNSGKLSKAFHIFDWTYEDVELNDYNPHPKIDFGAVTV
jgi:thymidylate synthase